MIKKSLIILLILISTKSFSQYYKTYDWTATPEHHVLTDIELKASSIGIKNTYIVEYAKSTFGQDLRVFETQHTITRVNDDKGIARHNTVYIPMYKVLNVVDIKARTIAADGKVTLLNKDNIKEVKNVEEYGDFKIFAIEGAEKNSEIEVLYTVQKEYDMHGSEVLQSENPIKEAQFIFITGEQNAKVKAYRTEKKFETINIDGKVAQQLTLRDIPAMIEEEYATPAANKIAVVYQCFPKGQNITQDMFWQNVISNIGPQFFPEKPSELVNEAILTFVGGKKDVTEYQIATLVDDYIKSNYTVVKNNNAELTDINYILKNKSASDFGIIKTYAHFLTALNIDYEIVVTANRFQYKFDPDFFTPNMLRDFMIYLPNQEKYISPDRIEYRVGEAPFNILGNYGLYISKDMSYYFSKIVQSDADFSRIKRITDISFDDDIESVNLNTYQEYYGHWSVTSRALLSLSSEQAKKDYQDYLTGSGIEDKVVKSFSTENTEMTQLEYNKPFIVKTELTSEALLEEAGDSYIFQIGKVIGTQSELYQETERVNPIEMTYPNQYDYIITLDIPKGYTAEGLEVLNIDKSYKSVKGNKLCKFESSYTLKDHKLVITIQEFYKSNEYDLNRYEEFRTVINAASDFNKASILLKAVE